jgi:trk system potassium uptake protein TrkA
MRIFIMGAGEVGIHIASSLVRERRHDLVVIERDAEKVTRLHSTMDILAVTGDGCDPDLLRERGVADADLFFAVSNQDAANLLAALTARKLGARRCVVRIGEPHLGANPLLEADPEVLPLYPERLVAEEVRGLTRVPGAVKARFFANGKLVLLQARPAEHADIYDRSLQDLHGPKGWVLTGIHRASGLIVPRGDTILRRGDLLYAVGRTDGISRYLDSIGVESRPTRSVVIAGAGQVGEWLARLLVADGVDVRVIQRGRGRAFDLAAGVPEALVLHGDARSPEILREAGVERADYFVAATQEDDVNLLSSLLAREIGARVVVALYNQPEFLNLLHAVRIDLPISPRLVVAGTILRMVHRREIVSLDLVEGGEAEVVEFQVPERARVLRGSLAELSFPRASIVGAVVRGEELFVPTGDFRFQVGDRALVFTLTETLPALEKLFRGRS